jgi:rhodanese-related sulfurtransferase
MEHPAPMDIVTRRFDDDGSHSLKPAGGGQSGAGALSFRRRRRNTTAGKKVSTGIIQEESTLIHRSAKKALWQTPALVLLSLAIGTGVNQWRSDGLALVGEPATLASLGPGGAHLPEMDIAEALQRFQQEGVLFVDARPASQYAEGHIRGALNLAWPQAETDFIHVADRLDAARVIITYCDGETCTLSHDLARFLTDMGFGDVRVLVNGWELWRQAGLPTDTKTLENG